VTVHVPLAVLNQVRADGFDWQVPGLRRELATELIRSLPKPVRRRFAPAPDHARAALERITPLQGPLVEALGEQLRRLTGVEVPQDAWNLDQVPDHLKVTFRVSDERHVLGEDKDLERLKLRLKGRVRAAISAAAGGIERRGLRSWSIGRLPRTVEVERGGRVVQGYPALMDEGDSVAVRILETEDAQARAMWQGTRRLLLLGSPSPTRFVLGRLGNRAKLTLRDYPHGSAPDLFDDCIACAADALMAEGGGPAWDAEGFAKLHDKVRGELADATLEVVTGVERILAAVHGVELRLADANPALGPALGDIRAQLDGLVYRGFVTATGSRRLPDVLRYVRGIQHRLDKLPSQPARDAELMADVEELHGAHRRRLDRVPPGGQPGEALREIRWMIEELRISYFAQPLGTPYPISAKRLRRALDQA
jgi:ATP-dependent helicase HrpA